MSDTTLTPTATLRYVGVADWWGFYVWIEEGASRRTLPYRGEAALASFAWGRPGLGARELARSIIEHATGSPALCARVLSERWRALLDARESASAPV